MIIRNKLPLQRSFAEAIAIYRSRLLILLGVAVVSFTLLAIIFGVVPNLLDLPPQFADKDNTTTPTIEVKPLPETPDLQRSPVIRPTTEQPFPDTSSTLIEGGIAVAIILSLSVLLRSIVALVKASRS